MGLAFKADFEATRERWARFWRGESTRPMLHAIQPKSDVVPVSRPRAYDCAFNDLDPIIDQVLGWASTHEFLGDAIPSFMITFAPDHFAALLGADIKRSAEGRTNWVEPCLTSLDDGGITFQRHGRWWERTLECIEKFRERCDGQLIITSTHLQGGLDGLVALYGTQNLLMDMATDPEAVLRALGQIDQALSEVRTALAEAVDVSTWGSLNRFGMHSSGIIDVPQCDVSCMISQEMFHTFELPSLTKEIASTDASIYHLDGPDALHHVESLCAIDGLDMIQWMPGEGYYDDDWSELNSRIDALGKGQIFQSYYKLTAADIERIWETYSSRKLFFHVSPEVLAQIALMNEDGSR
jgi:5-methyltetrahydrofolate--homocysteine methyltransferase